MNYIAKYSQDIGFDWDIGKLLENKLDLRQINPKRLESLFSQMTIDLLMLKALRGHFNESQIVSSSSLIIYVNLLKNCSDLTQEVKKRIFSIPFEINYNLFSQEKILTLHKEKYFEHIQGMANFAGEEYFKRFEKRRDYEKSGNL